MEHEELYGHDWDYFKNKKYLSFYKDPNLSPWKGKQVVKCLKKIWRLVQKRRGFFWKNSTFGLKICVVNYLFSPWYRQVIPLTLMDNFMAANNICS